MASRLHASAPRRKGRFQPMSEINVTPFVDVMLVLLIVFMVTAPLLTVGVPVDLPKAQARSIVEPDEPLVVSVDSSGQIFIQGNNYGHVMQVLGRINAAGFTRVALITELPKIETGDG
jgi:biopolymer transport protein TolR